jgi:hypothetical protein
MTFSGAVNVPWSYESRVTHRAEPPWIDRARGLLAGSKDRPKPTMTDAESPPRWPGRCRLSRRFPTLALVWWHPGRLVKFTVIFSERCAKASSRPVSHKVPGQGAINLPE